MDAAAIPAAQTDRRRILLDGEWRFRHEAGEWRSIHVPGVWQAQFDDLRLAAGTACYRRSFGPVAREEGTELALRFGAVNFLAEVHLNGRRLGQHEGGWLPFEFLIRPEDVGEENELEVLVSVPSSARIRPQGQPSFSEIPHGKQSWYGPLSGIWQPVWLEQRHPLHIRSCRIRADLASSTVEANVLLSREDADADIEATITAPGGRKAGAAKIAVSAGSARLLFNVEHPEPWSPASPRLYRIELQVLHAGRSLDTWRDSFGFRTIEIQKGRFFLNGAPLYLRGALDQDYYADGIIAPTSPALFEDQLRKAKALGFNCLRCHIKVPDPFYYEAADRLGMLVWSEIPNVAEFNDSAAERLWTTLEGILDRDGNHPSIIAWTIVNEDWGTELDEDPDHRIWLAEAFAKLKALDPTRLVVDNSPCFPNFHVRTDINDFHYYRAIPDHRDEWDWITEQFASRPSWTFAPESRPTGEEPLVVSEFGLWGLPNPKELADDSGREPWWFETGELFGDGVAYPHGIERRFHLLALKPVFGSFEAFIEATQRHQFSGLKYQIESLRRQASIQGYVITELTDVYWEANGLMDMRRNLRLFAKDFAHVNAELVVLPRLERYAYWCGQLIRISLAIATGADPYPGGVIEWSIEPGGLGGRITVPAAEPCSVTACPPIELRAPRSAGPQMVQLCLSLRDANGNVRARNDTDIALYPNRNFDTLPSIWTRDEEIASLAGTLGYGNAAVPEAADVIVLRAVDTAAVEAIRTGARCLLFADGPGNDGWLRSDHPVQAAVPTVPAPVNPPFPGLMRRVRRGNVWRGDWITNFGWIARQGAFADLPGGPLLDLSFDRVAPAHVLWGSVRPWEYEAGIMPAGVVVGWVHKPAGFIMQKRFGKGKLVMSTFRLTRDLPGVDPVAAALFDRLVLTTLED